MRKQTDPLIIANFDTGISPSPHVGTADMRNLDISSIPGVAIINNSVTKRSGSVVDATINWLERDPVATGTCFALDSNGTVYNSEDSGDTWREYIDRGGAGEGMKIWKNYLFVATTTGLDVYGPLAGGTAAWSTDWKTIDTSNIHPLIISRNDGKLYGGAGRYVFSVEEAAGQTFAPGNAATYTFTQQALDLPANYRIKALEELGITLMIGTIASAGHQFLKVADIFPWDRSSSSFDLPLSLNVNGVHAMLTVNNQTYILAGLEGKVYLTNGVQVVPVAQIPLSVTSPTSSSTNRNIIPSPGAFVNFKERPTFAFDYGIGVWSLQPTSKGHVLNLEHMTSVGAVTDNDTSIRALLPLSQSELLIGWKSSDTNTTYGIDKTDNTARYTGFTGYMDSAFYQVGTYHNKKTFQELEFQLAKPLVTGQGVAFRYRTNLTSSFTLIGTYTHSTAATTQIGAKQSHVVKPGIPSCEFVQLRVSLAPGTTDANSSPHLRQIILR